MIRVTAFRSVPAFARGLVRDLRVRWALEEAGLEYETRLLEPGQQGERENRALQPFGQVPSYEEDGFALFESGSIVLHVGQRSTTLLPVDPKERARAITWAFAALNSVEPPLQELAALDVFFPNATWPKERRPGLEALVRRRLAELSAALWTRDYLENRFTAGDLLMTTVLRIVRHTPLVSEYPALVAYQSRCEARPAFRKALADQLADLADKAS